MKWDVLIPAYVKDGRANVAGEMIDVYRVRWLDRGTVTAPSAEEALQRAKLMPGVLICPAVQPSRRTLQ
jgi:hypothetical protein